jgi:hypothetical protein
MAPHYRWLYYITHAQSDITAGRGVLNTRKKETESRKGNKRARKAKHKRKEE